MLTIQTSAIASMNIINPKLDANLVKRIAQHAQILFNALKQSLIETFLVVKYIFLSIIAGIDVY